MPRDEKHYTLLNARGQHISSFSANSRDVASTIANHITGASPRDMTFVRMYGRRTVTKRCINAPDKTKNDVGRYTGTEPSPKGVGQCARYEKPTTVIRGKDGNDWLKGKSGKWQKMKSTYLTHANMGRPYLVDLKGKEAFIYRDTSKYNEDDIDIGKEGPYDKFITYAFEKAFVGESPKNKMTKFSGGFGLTGNSILLYIGEQNEKHRYVFIGDQIYEFSTNRRIKSFLSPVGNSDVPYPTAMDGKNVYFFLDRVYVEKKFFRGIKKMDWTDLYTYFYGHHLEDWHPNYRSPIQQHAKPMQDYKQID